MSDDRVVLGAPQTWLLGGFDTDDRETPSTSHPTALVLDGTAAVEASDPAPAGFSHTWHDDLWIGVLGGPMCPGTIPFESRLARYVRDGDTSFTEAGGSWAAVVYDRTQRKFVLISDCIGSWPLYICESATTGVHFATDATRLMQRGYVPPALDPDAIATWVWLGFNISRSGLWRGTRQLPPATALEIDAQGQVNETTYLTPGAYEPVRSRKEARERFHDIIGAHLAAAAARSPDINVLLSGGLDSRYLLAQLQANAGDRTTIHLTTIDEDGEARFADSVAKAVGLDLAVLPDTLGNLKRFWQFRHRTHDGTILGKHGTFFAARHRGPVPVVLGYLGDAFIRISKARKLEKQIEGASNPAQVYTDAARSGPASLIEPRLLDALRERTLANYHRILTTGMAGQPAQTYDVYGREGRLITNNYLQTADTNQAFLPVLSWPLVAQYLYGSYEFMDDELYQELFDRLGTDIGRLPTYVVTRNSRAPSSMMRQQAQFAARALFNPMLGGMLRPRWALPRIAAAAASGHTHTFVTEFISRLALQANEIAALAPGTDFDLRTAILD